ncbi:NAD(P)/FAD-dependent oxidoreductase [Ovoidimarina sediminis]|uniref:NAD(P)/FAD-dependent oxidoreductase n=1 Tax=Ovoidimarina sediminis TaxID=3079856 RepID=UPI00290A9FD4|nr:FAD-dependent oxidoreductase [Rhodophyticola sp. MJ-SS7]MDU8945226.1 FAD-dependent oxidoreductase [Rhodophyticola sp. MJ-SS7]
MTRAIAIIGAGLCGITAARELSGHVENVVVFEKSRGLGGRMATRRFAGLSINHGAPRVTPGNPELEGLLLAAGASQDSLGGWVGRPGMSSIARCMAKGLRIETRHSVTAIIKGRGGFYLEIENDRRQGPFARVILAVPAPQARVLLSALPGISKRLADIEFNPVWAFMAAFGERLDAPNRLTGPVFHRLFRQELPEEIQATRDVWVGHATAEWSSAYLEMPDALVETSMQAAFAAALGHLPPEPLYCAVHRWRYALAQKPLGEPYLEVCNGQLLVGGDWALGHGFDDAWMSGRAMAERVLLTLPGPTARGRDRAWRSDLTN